MKWVLWIEIQNKALLLKLWPWYKIAFIQVIQTMPFHFTENKKLLRSPDTFSLSSYNKNNWKEFIPKCHWIHMLAFLLFCGKRVSGSLTAKCLSFCCEKQNLVYINCSFNIKFSFNIKYDIFIFYIEKYFHKIHINTLMNIGENV